MKFFKTGSFTRDIFEHAVTSMGYEPEFTDFEIGEGRDSSEVWLEYEISNDTSSVSDSLEVYGTVSYDAEPYRFEVELSGMKRVREEILDRMYRQSLEYFERLSKGEQGLTSNMEGFLSCENELIDGYFSDF